MFLNYINIPVFLISLILGLLFVYFNAPDNKQVLVYPTPTNLNHIQYRDYANNCFEFNMDKVKCPKDKSNVKEIPVQSFNK